MSLPSLINNVNIQTIDTSVVSMPVEQVMIFASLALLVYDYFLTLGSEIERFWKRISRQRPSYGSLLFFVNRYLVILGYMPIVIEGFNQIKIDATSCKHFLFYTMWWQIVIQIIIGIIMLKRVCALYQQQTVILLAFSAIVVIYIIAFVTIVMIKAPRNNLPDTVLLGCHLELTADQAYYLVAAWSGEFLFDIVIFAMTLHRTVKLSKENSIGLLMMRDGTVYFSVIVAFNLANILVLLFFDPLNRGAMINPMSIISSIMMTHLMLNLRDPKLSGLSEGTKLTPIEFNGQAGSQETSDSLVNTQSDEGSV